MAGMFERMDAATRLSDNNSFPYLRSHPLTVDRISEARNRTLLAGGTPSQPTLQHAMMQARSRVLMDDATLAQLAQEEGDAAGTARCFEAAARLG